MIGEERRTQHLRMDVLVHEGGQQPTKGHYDDAGLDLFVSETVVVPSGQFRDVHCGVSVALPEGTWGLLTGRSSTLRKRSLMVAQGVIDAGYRGPLFAGVWNLGPESVTIEKGDRISQLILIENVTESTLVYEVGSLNDGTRGLAGFGSTGA